MATRKRNVSKKAKTRSTKKYFMKGCAMKIKNKSLAFKLKHKKTCPKCSMRGGCGTCSMGGGNKIGGAGSLGFMDNIYNIGTNFTSGLTNFTSSVLYASPPLPNALPTTGQFVNKYN